MPPASSSEHPPRLRAAALVALLLAACTLEPAEDPTTPADGALGSACDDASPCDEDLVCAQGGHLAGQCVVPCEADSDCRLLASDSHYCLDGACTRVCRDGCNLGAVVAGCAAGERCVTQDRIQSGASSCLSWCVP